MRVGIDIGGTFTDLCVSTDGAHGADGTGAGILALGKTLTTHDEPARGVEQVLAETLAAADLDPSEVTGVVHGTTLVTNALIERRGARTAVVTTAGFRDVLEMGREHRYELYDLGLELPRPLVPRHLRFDVGGRLLADGTEEQPLDVDHLRRLAAELADHGVEAVAVCFLHSHVDDRHERAAREVITEAAPGLRVALSSEVNPEIREYERFSTTVADVYVQGLTAAYLDDLRARLERLGVPKPPLVMLSHGGVATLEVAARHPIRMLESGPAGGALGAVRVGAARGVGDLMAFDMGGTTAKFCVVQDGRPLVSHAFEVARLYRMRPGSGLPVRAPVIDMIEIGAGGGSVAVVDPLGLVQVGPRSAGSEPGPVCYGRGGEEVTVTDADLVLGYLGPDSFGSGERGGGMRLDVEAARVAVRRQVAEPMGIGVEEAAWAIHAVVDENMATAARVHAVERGTDVTDLPLFVSGGNGPLHGPGLAAALGSPAVLVPPAAGVLSAAGLLAAPLSIDLVVSAHADLDTLTAAEATTRLGELAEQAGSVLVDSGVARDDVTVSHAADLRFVGQGTEVEVAVPGDGDDWPRRAREAFTASYAERFGRAAPRDVGVEVLTWRVTARGPDPDARLAFADPGTAGAADESTSVVGRRQAWFRGPGFVDTPVHSRDRLRPGAVLDGPALVEEASSTLLVPPGAHAEVGEDGAIWMELDR